MSTTTEKVGIGVAAVLLPIIWLINVGTHFGITVVAYQFSGFMAALLTLVTPVLSTIYWYWQLTSHFGFLGHWWLVCATCSLGLLGIVFAFAARKA